jgi:hypothetical protein
MFQRQVVEQELDEELRFHIERQIEQNVARGLTLEEVRGEALKLFGGVDQRKEECRDRRGLNALESLLKDLEYALRRLAQHPLFSLAAILTIALGTGSIVPGGARSGIPHRHGRRDVRHGTDTDCRVRESREHDAGERNGPSPGNRNTSGLGR